MISLREVYLLVSKSLPPTIPSHLSVFRPPFLSLLFLEDPSLRISTDLARTNLGQKYAGYSCVVPLAQCEKEWALGSLSPIRSMSVFLIVFSRSIDPSSEPNMRICVAHERGTQHHQIRLTLFVCSSISLFFSLIQRFLASTLDSTCSSMHGGSFGCLLRSNAFCFRGKVRSNCSPSDLKFLSGKKP